MRSSPFGRLVLVALVAALRAVHPRPCAVAPRRARAPRCAIGRRHPGLPRRARAPGRAPRTTTPAIGIALPPGISWAARRGSGIRRGRAMFSTPPPRRESAGPSRPCDQVQSCRSRHLRRAVRWREAAGPAREILHGLDVTVASVGSVKLSSWEGGAQDIGPGTRRCHNFRGRTQSG